MKKYFVFVCLIIFTTMTAQFYAGTGYYVKADKINRVYFYSKPNLKYKKKSYFTSKEIVYPKAFKNGFADIEFVNSKGQKSIGWIRIKDLEK